MKSSEVVEGTSAAQNSAHILPGSVTSRKSGSMARNPARDIAAVLLKYRRSGRSGCDNENCAECQDLLERRIKTVIADGRPLEIIMPSFASKSSLRANTISSCADMADRVAIASLARITQDIRDVYPGGATFLIASDAWLFQPLRSDAGFDVNIEDVERYLAEITEMAEDQSSGSIKIITPTTFYPDVLPGKALLARLLTEWEPRSVDEVVAYKIALGSSEPIDIKRYWARDFLSLDLARGLKFSNKQLKHMSEQKLRSEPFAARAMQATSAWSNLIAVKYPNAIRASIHPRCLHVTGTQTQERLGVRLAPPPPESLLELLQMKSEPLFVSPWRGAWMVDSATGGGVTVRASFARSLGATLITNSDGTPSHFVL